LSCARDEIRKAQDYDYIVVNDIIDRAVSDIEAIIRSEKLRSERSVATLDTLLRQ